MKLPDDIAENDDHLDQSEGFYRHKHRPEWGYAIQAWSRKQKRAYQFDDGSLRVLRQGFFSLMIEAEPPEDAERLLRELRRLTGREDDDAKKKSLTLKSVLTWEQQITVLERDFPGGFQGEEWKKTVRGEGAKRRLKRHRDPAIADAREMLSLDRLDEAIESDEHEAVLTDVRALLRSSNLVNKRYLDQLMDLSGPNVRAFVVGIRELLHGGETYRRRFRQWLSSQRSWFGRAPSWRSATALPALVHPDKHICVQATPFLAQAAEVRPAGRYAKKPRSRSYKEFRALANRVEERLRESNHEPADLMDVRDFIVRTQSNAAARSLAKD